MERTNTGTPQYDFVGGYQKFQRKLLRIINVSIIILSTSSLASAISNAGYTILATTLLTLISFLKEIVPNYIFDEKKISSMDNIHSFYCKYLDQLEQLWYSEQRGELNEKELAEKYYQIKEQEHPYNAQINELFLFMPGYLIRRAEKETNLYCQLNH